MDEKLITKARRLIRRANFRLQAHEYDAAFATYQEALEYLPESVEILNTMAAIAERIGKPEEGVRLYRDSLAMEIRDETQINLGFLLLKSHQFEEARDIFQRLNLDSSLVKAGLGMSLVALNDNIPHAINLLRATIHLDHASGSSQQDNLNVSSYLGIAYSQYGQPNLALNEFRKDLYDWKNKHAMGILYLQLNSPRSANAKFQEARQRYLATYEEHDQEILDKLHFDMILSLTSPTVQLTELKTLEKKVKNYELYHALAASEYQVHGATSEFEEYCNLAKSFTQNTINLEIINKWLTLFDPNIDTAEGSP